MGDNSPERKSGCGLLNAVFGRKSFWPRRATSTGSLPTGNPNNEFVKPPNTPESRRRRNSSDEIAFLASSGHASSTGHNLVAPPKPAMKKTQNGLNQHDMKRPPQESNNPTSRVSHYQGYVNQGRRVPKEAIGISGELENMITDHQKNAGSSTLVRASSSNVMLFGNLGNIRQPGGGNTTNSYNVVLDYLPKPAREENPIPNGKHTGNLGGNLGKINVKEAKPSQEQASGSLCRAISTRMDPETLKIMGNEDYKNGRFAEALALYEAAISIDPNKASYRSNKSAALTALGRILEAVLECREAIRIEPHYHRAHHRLATLYLRLGEPEKATYHYKHAGQEADREDLAKVRSLQAHLNKCTEARRLRDWNTLIKETELAISAGADSAPQIYALQAEAFLKLHKHQEADKAFSRGPKFEVDACIKFLGPIGNSNLLVVQAQIDMAAGRFEDALEAAQRATRLDSNNREASMVMRKARAVAGARSKGNELFKASRFSEACVAYGEGLENDPYNAVLLCNRAASRSKLGHFEKALDDCTAALNVRPSYSKARLRRADCNAKLERWDASIQDYEVLVLETPEDEEVKKALVEAQSQLRKQRGKGGKEVEN